MLSFRTLGRVYLPSFLDVRNDMTFYEQIDQNKRNTLLIIFIFLVLVGIIAYVFGQATDAGYSYVIPAFGFSLFSSFGSYFFGDKIILTLSGARPADKTRDFNFFTVAENLSIGSGIPMPKLYVIADSAPNAFATGRDSNHSVICATTGLLEKLDRTELEAVIAHELSHIRNYDIRLMMIVSVLVGMVAFLADLFRRRMFFGGGRRKSKEGDSFALFVIIGLILSIFAPIFAKLIQLALSRQREYLADASAVSLTKQPGGLISALQKISAYPEPLEVANRATAHLYIVSPFKGQLGEVVNNAFSTHPPVADRIKRLKEL